MVTNLDIDFTLTDRQLWHTYCLQ